MKHYLLVFFSVLTIFSARQAESSLLYIPKASGDVLYDELGLDIDKSIEKKYRAAAKFLSPAASQYSDSKNTMTNIVTYETTSLGVTCHIAWYQDGFIGTALDGTEQGKQLIFVNGALVGISYDIEIFSDHFEHKYTWGKVYSYPHKQFVNFY